MIYDIRRYLEAESKKNNERRKIHNELLKQKKYKELIDMLEKEKQEMLEELYKL